MGSWLRLMRPLPLGPRALNWVIASGVIGVCLSAAAERDKKVKVRQPRGGRPQPRQFDAPPVRWGSDGVGCPVGNHVTLAMARK